MNALTRLGTVGMNLRSEAQAVRTRTSKKAFHERRCLLAGRIADSLKLWNDAHADDSLPGIRTVGLLHCFWCQVLSGTTHYHGDKYLLECSPRDKRAHVNNLRYILLAKDCPDYDDYRALILNLCETIVDTCVDLSKELRMPGSEWPHARHAHLPPGGVDYSDTMEEEPVKLLAPRIRTLRVVGGTESKLT